jgi:hypothetical protein
MKIIELSYFYDQKKMRELRKAHHEKGKPFLMKSIDGIRILVIHGSKSGIIPGIEKFAGLYDELISCYYNFDEQKTWSNSYHINGRNFFILGSTDEYNLFNKEYFASLVSSLDEQSEE